MQESMQKTKLAYSTPNLYVTTLSLMDVLTISPNSFSDEDETQFRGSWID